jgi:transposase
MNQEGERTNMAKSVYSDEFKKQIVALYNNGKPDTSIVKEYGISRAAIYKWNREANASGSFKAKDNRTPEENELIQLRKDLQQLKMENDILKQAALIMGRK